MTTVPYVQLDITDRDAVIRTIEDIKPDAIIRCAAWTAVDAEDEENQVKVHAINAVGTQNIADAAKAVDAKMIYLSRITYLMVRVQDRGSRMIRTMRR